MPSIEVSKLQGIGPSRALTESDRTESSAQTRQPPREAGAAATQPGVVVEVGAADFSSTPPVDSDRVSQVRKALQDGTYPLVPTKIVDAMIAARISLGQPS